MAWSNYDIFIHLGSRDVFRSEGTPYHIGGVKARTKDEAEKKGIRIARLRGLCGLIEVKRIIAPR